MLKVLMGSQQKIHSTKKRKNIIFIMRKNLESLVFWKLVIFSAVFFLSALGQSYAMDVTLQWDVTTEPNLAGYKIYYKADTSGPPYNGEGAIESDSPINVGNVTSFTAHGLTDDGTYFFVVTAYDNQGLESGYSNEVSINSSTTLAYDGGVSSSSNGGGGGCFIATAAYGSPMSSKVRILCQFREEYLRPISFGSEVIALYERYSPYFADRISNNEGLKAAAQWRLWPVIGVAYLCVNSTFEQKTILLVIFAVSSLAFFFRRMRLLIHKF